MVKKNNDFQPDYSSELNIESIISAPLVAASKANVVMLTGQTRFLLDYCFTKINNSGKYEPVMIEMSMYKSFVDSTKDKTDSDFIKTEKMFFSLPLLCLVPLNSLAIDKINVDFDMEITSMTSYSYESSDQDILKKNQGIEKKAQLNGKISNQRESKGTKQTQSSSKLVVNINASPLPLPTGVLTIIDLYTKTIQPIPQQNKINAT